VLFTYNGVFYWRLRHFVILLTEYFHMPIYAYRCSDCGHSKDALQKMSDAPLTTCPACGKETFSKQVTAAGFALKGSGWYVTDFRGGNTAEKSSSIGGESSVVSASKPLDAKVSDTKTSDTKTSDSAPSTSTESSINTSTHLTK
jgi:putative FmdB family regulatory protein